MRVETLEISANEPCPRGIVGQLLEIAKENDAMSEIGGATSWRWQEGIISRMPKTKTVAKILTKAFGTDNPHTWLSKTEGDLKYFIKYNFGLENWDKFLNGNFVRDLYDSLFVIMAGSGKGTSHEELIHSFSYFKFAEGFIEDSDYSVNPQREELIGLYGDWANKKLENVLENVFHEVVDGKFKIPKCSFVASEKHLANVKKINELRLKTIGFNSHFDMWRFFNLDLTDDHHIELERELIKLYDKFLKKSLEVSEKSTLQATQNTVTRVYMFDVITIPNGKEKTRCE